jgi:hypothetical protein
MRNGSFIHLKNLYIMKAVCLVAAGGGVFTPSAGKRPPLGKVEW